MGLDVAFFGEFEKLRDVERAGRMDEAIAGYERIVREINQFWGAHQRLAIIYRKREDFVNEIRIITDALAAASRDWIGVPSGAETQMTTTYLVERANQVSFLSGWANRLSAALRYYARKIVKEANTDTQLTSVLGGRLGKMKKITKRTDIYDNG
jgi:hypothetical protein